MSHTGIHLVGVSGTVCRSPDSDFPFLGGPRVRKPTSTQSSGYGTHASAQADGQAAGAKEVSTFPYSGCHAALAGSSAQARACALSRSRLLAVDGAHCTSREREGPASLRASCVCALSPRPCNLVEKTRAGRGGADVKRESPRKRVLRLVFLRRQGAGRRCAHAHWAEGARWQVSGLGVGGQWGCRRCCSLRCAPQAPGGFISTSARPKSAASSKKFPTRPWSSVRRGEGGSGPELSPRRRRALSSQRHSEDAGR